VSRAGETAKEVSWPGKKGRPAKKVSWTEGRQGGKAVALGGETPYLSVNMKDQKTPFTLTMWAYWNPTDVKKAADQRLFTLLRDGTEYQVGFTPWLVREQSDGMYINGMAIEDRCQVAGEWHRRVTYDRLNEQVCGKMTQGEWVLVAMSVTEKQVALYVDGVLWKRVDLPYTYSALEVDTLLLGSAVNGTSGFKGMIQDCRLYDGVLSDQQIERMYQGVSIFDATKQDTAPTFVQIPVLENVAYDKTYTIETVSRDGEVKTVLNADTTLPGLWETPSLGMGQTVSGTITFINQSDHLVDFSLNAIGLPEKNTPEWRYLSDLHVQFSGDLSFTGTFTDLTPDQFKIERPMMRKGEQYVLHYTFTRPLRSDKGAFTVTTPWNLKFDVLRTQNALPKETHLPWLLPVIVVAVALLCLSVYWTIARHLPGFLTKKR
jgi:hypothetical protein